ncbi:MAG: glycosyltransferase family A protein [Elusimicrobiota bacterium]|nr:glycosyltransferase family A protein [Elusimicrobiota bacterium]
MPRVSVVIPAYNAAKFITATLDSVAAQTFADWELVVVDDGSTDDTKAVVDAWLARTGKAGTCVRRANGRIAAARNTGLQAAKGELVALLDHDDLWTPDKLARCVAELDAHPGCVLVGHHTDVVQDGKVLRVERKGPGGTDLYDRLLFEANCVAPSAAVFRKDAALAIGGFREGDRYNTVEDYDFWMRLARRGEFRFLDAVLSSYTVVPGSASRRVQYHHDNLEALLREHFRERLGPEPGVCARLRMSRRLSFVYRSATAALLEPGADKALRRAYARRMLASWPFSLKNAGRFVQCLLADLSGK